MAFKVILLSRAKNEISAAIEWNEERQKGLGQDFLNEVETEIRRIQESPLIYPFSGGINSQIRKAVVKRFPFLVLFTVSHEEVLIQSVFYTHLNPTKKPSV